MNDTNYYLWPIKMYLILHGRGPWSFSIAHRWCWNPWIRVNSTTIISIRLCFCFSCPSRMTSSRRLSAYATQRYMGDAEWNIQCIFSGKCGFLCDAVPGYLYSTLVDVYAVCEPHEGALYHSNSGCSLRGRCE